MIIANILVETFLKGGVIMWPLLLCLLLSVAVVIERLLWWRKVGALRQDKAFAQAVWDVRLGNFAEAWRRTHGSASPFLVTLRSALANGRTDPVAAMQLRAEEGLEEAGAWQWVLSTVITLAPLLGLLGTVIGIMQSFDFIGSEQLAVAKVSGGIGEALIATATGLGTAILCLLPHNLFNHRAQKLRHDLEQAVNQADLALRDAGASGHRLVEFDPNEPDAVRHP